MESNTYARPRGAPRLPSHDETTSTRERLILTAERLMAEEGIGRVSLRRINTEAGARNLSAVHYHFNSLEGIISAIFDYRMPDVDRRRNEMIGELVAAGQQRDLAHVLHAVVWPLAELLLSGARANSYVRFLAEVSRTPSLDNWTASRSRHRRGLVRCYVMVRRIVDTVPKGLLHVRMVLGLREAIYALADVERVVIARQPGLRDALVLYHASDLITRLERSLTAPASEATRMAQRALEVSATGRRAPLFGIDALWALGDPRDHA